MTDESTGGVPAFRRISDLLRERVEEGSVGPDEVLSVLGLAEEFAVARGTVERALEHLAASQGLVARQGRRWVAQRRTIAQDVGVVRSFGQWARAMGMEPSGRFIRRDPGRASAEEARELSLRVNDPVLRILRVRALDSRPVMVERTSYPGRLAATILALPEDAPSVAEAVVREFAVPLGHAEHRIHAAIADTTDRRLLAAPTVTAVLKVVRTTRFAHGRPFEFSDDGGLNPPTHHEGR